LRKGVRGLMKGKGTNLKEGLHPSSTPERMGGKSNKRRDIYMRKRWKLFCLASLVVVVILAVAGCGKPTIVGNWQSTENADVQLEFTEAGYLIVDTGSYIVNGTYEVLDDNDIKINIEGLADILVPLFNADTWKYEVTSSNLTLSVDSTIKTFKKAERY
jgi:hypothetical protein